MKKTTSRFQKNFFNERPLTVILLTIFLALYVLFVSLQDQHWVEGPRKIVPAEKRIFELSDVLLENDLEYAEMVGVAAAPGKNPQKFDYRIAVEDVTGRGDVRQTSAALGVDYKLSHNTTLGVEAGSTLHDPQDASAWGKSVEDEQIAQARYRVSF